MKKSEGNIPGTLKRNYKTTKGLPGNGRPFVSPGGGVQCLNERWPVNIMATCGSAWLQASMDS